MLSAAAGLAATIMAAPNMLQVPGLSGDAPGLQRSRRVYILGRYSRRVARAGFYHESLGACRCRAGAVLRSLIARIALTPNGSGSRGPHLPSRRTKSLLAR
jgi:hypothetical protein